MPIVNSFNSFYVYFLPLLFLKQRGVVFVISKITFYTILFATDVVWYLLHIPCPVRPPGQAWNPSLYNNFTDKRVTHALYYLPAMIYGQNMIGRVLDWAIRYGPHMMTKMIESMKDQEKVWVGSVKCFNLWNEIILNIEYRLNTNVYSCLSLFPVTPGLFNLL